MKANDLRLILFVLNFPKTDSKRFIHLSIADKCIYGQEDVEWLMSADEVREFFKNEMRR